MMICDRRLRGVLVVQSSLFICYVVGSEWKHSVEVRRQHKLLLLGCMMIVRTNKKNS